MRHSLKAETMPGSVLQLHSWHLRASVPSTSSGQALHALASRQLRDLLLSSIALLLISLFTIVSIVSIVTTVHERIAATRPPSRWTVSPATNVSELSVGTAATRNAAMTERADYRLDPPGAY
ncbi:MAG: hypothetical protein JW993_12355 [Sedimentisphaerales bacterium]|nr:hypothetical protein [Sedimentisphaerales bacterium]